MSASMAGEHASILYGIEVLGHGILRKESTDDPVAGLTGRLNHQSEEGSCTRLLTRSIDGVRLD